ncbi:DNA-3-methyladenine glycosylase [Micromonospora yangpuensis]|uniref:DNA-3-methyladenine glycosylase II n=1 Tax=Micromonospora yangpuensis TaxID=683228 RepID=A0A1C6VAI3_9ACTN|nr:AlkA N-terminal domain-containing protein [Micromonospora yangpuensis]GGM21931.1 DNA-3-methyladenine glycosylase [Micromonospora yangpuensis]SCL62880.1 DNA-3-methyladenine glycosylase II [Micromonospora yangpuensis]
MQELDFERCYRAVDSRDQRFDGCFYTGVTSTGIYCRPSCPAVTPRRRNVRFFPSAAAAQGAGLRACRRCRPDAAPGSPQWDARADVVGRAVRLIADGVVDRAGVPGLASRLGYTERHLHRMLRAELGAGPLALARAQRAQTARILITTTGLGMAEAAFAAGFGSVRQFNDTIRAVYGLAPSQLRADGGTGTPGTGTPGTRAPGIGTPGTGGITLRLAYRPPLHAESLLDFLAVRALPGLEEVRDGTYRRGLRLPHGAAEVALTPADGHVLATLRLADLRDLAPAVARCRRLLDLDADPVAADATLAADPALAASVAAEPGVRLPRAVDGFEILLRALVTQQISLPAARTTLTRLLTAVPAAGPPTFPTTEAGPPTFPTTEAGPPVFPTAEQVAALPDAAFGMPVRRRETIRAAARAVAAGELDLDPGGDRAETLRRLSELPGIGPWTAGYVAMRALGDPDVFLPTDLGVRRGAAALGLPDDPKTLDAYAERWRPWRSYAVIRLWRAA